MFLLIGALTNKPHSFKTRSWELNTVETIDIFDALCSNIRIDVKGSDIVRILPINNKFINEEWISDKTRFGYDSFHRWRFIYPMFKYNNLFFHTSWNNLFKILRNKITNNKFNNIIIKTGSFIDLETLVAIQTFSEKNNNIILNNALNTESDLNNYFFDIKELKNNNIYLFIGNNLRYENPILNIKFKKLTNSKVILIGYLGVKYDVNFNILHLGTNLKTLKYIFEGKHIFIKFIKLFLKNSFIINHLFNDKLWLIFGKDFTNRISTKELNKFLQNFTNNRFCYTFLQESVGKLNLLTLNTKNYKKIDKKKSNIYYILGVENIKNLTFKDFIIFQGHHNDIIRLKFNLILPTISWIEKSSIYLNSFGFIQRSNFILTPFINTRLDWKIIRMISIFLNKDIGYKNVLNIYKRLNDLIPNFKNLLFKYDNSIKYNIKYITKYSKKISIIDENPFVTFYPYYYFLNSIERSSKTLNFVLNTLKKEESNFIN